MKQRDRFQLVQWVPGNEHSLVIVFRNDIYYIADIEKLENFVRVTSSGKDGIIFNGIPDWLYEGMYIPCTQPLTSIVYKGHG